MLYEDNKTSITLIKNGKSQAHTKYIDVQQHYIQELVADQELKVE